ncbi:MAG: xanthine dehydrogenase molybdenum-binding subunit XdhA [Clostridiales bacterium]|nr:xanthine dehydrogenase molybdenum-binding subunit XdhA [Clostridiales bacterium]
MSIGQPVRRVDAYDKVTGRAKYTDDLLPRDHLVAKVLHSTIANGLVKDIRTEKALELPGVVKIVTCFDVPQNPYPTPGHPWSTDPGHQDVADRLMLNTRVRQWGDDIAAVIAEDETTAVRALGLIEVEYEEYPPLVSAGAAMAEGADEIHTGHKQNILKRTGSVSPDFAIKSVEEGLLWVSGTFHTQQVQQCHMENPVSYAYMEHERVVVVSSTQIPHIVRRVVGQALGLPWGKIRVIKPYVGGGFGNKQEVLYEPLNAFLTMQAGGRCVKLELSREETFSSTRSRHAMDIDLESWVKPDGTLRARKFRAVSDQGGYASHGHAIIANSASSFRQLYPYAALDSEALTVYSNRGTAGAMRGYGVPQTIFAMESHMDDIALKLGLDPIELRLKNVMRQGFVDVPTGVTCLSNGLAECLELGGKHIGWKEKRARYAKKQSGDVRRGIGMAIFSYKSNVWSVSLETASARLIMNQDGSVQLQLGATEIGQGADTVFCQMASDVLGVPLSDVHIVSTQDTDVAPFDTGAYASRQTYVTGQAVKQTALLLKERVLDFAALELGRPARELDIAERQIVEKTGGTALASLAGIALEAFYSLKHSRHLTAESTYHCRHNTFSFGACFAEAEVDMPLGKVRILDIINVHDSGRLINPALAAAQVHGGMSMALGYALSEQMLYDNKGRLLNGNLLDYKLPTALDTPNLAADFAQTFDESGPFGNKSLGEPPAVVPAAAIRNALLQATGIGFNSLPMNPQALVKAFKAAGII